MKRILTIQDVSCVGKCSLTVALPIISCMGVEAGVMPTAVLSTHTAFQNFTFHDLTGEMRPIANHFQNEGFHFDAIYTGYLGSFEQIQIVSEVFEKLSSKDTKIVIDPAMADNGKLYKGFTEEFAQKMAGLCKYADLVVPNITEACFMLGIDYKEHFTKEEVQSILIRLTELGAKSAAITGMSFDEGKLGVYAYTKETNEFFYYVNDKLPVSYHGTGDIFASTTVGALARGKTLARSLTIAVDYTLEAMKETQKDPDSNWYGVNFESAMPFLVNEINKD